MPNEVYKAKEEKGVVILAHGLNTNPKRFEALINIFVEQGFHTIMVTLTGHEKEDYASFSKVDAKQWEADIKNAFDEARNSFPHLRDEIWTCGYSLGGLAQIVVGASEEYRPKGMILLAGALTPKWYTHIVKSLLVFPKHWALKSYSIKSYESHSKVPLAAYGSLFALVKRVGKQNFSDWNTPVVMWIDPKDELVSLKRTRRFVEKNGLNNWSVHQLQVSKSEKKNRFHHLIINPDSMSASQWESMTSDMLAFIEEHSGA